MSERVRVRDVAQSYEELRGKSRSVQVYKGYEQEYVVDLRLHHCRR